MVNVNIIYHHFPHYRYPVMRELVVNGRFKYRFFGGVEEVMGIKAFSGDEFVKINPLEFKIRGRYWILRGYLSAVFDRTADVVVVIGNPNMPASWIIALLCRLLGKKIFFWAHGWLKLESPIKRLVRNFYFGLSNKVLVYGERAKLLGVASGFPSQKISVIYNSLDFDRAHLLLDEIENNEGVNTLRPQLLFKEPSLPILICTARLTSICRLDLLIEAAAIIKTNTGKSVNILLVGDGPEKVVLKELADKLNVNVVLFGACYDERIIANLIYHSDLTVSPGKIGLTVIHSLMYGTPAITHGDFDMQMPEVEAIEPGISGVFFERNSSRDLAVKIIDWLNRDVPREQIRTACRKVVLEKWNPATQRRLIESAIDDVLSMKETSL